MRKKHLLFLVVVVISLLTSACITSTPVQTPPSVSNPIELNVSAALGLQEALLDIKKDYEQSHPNITIVYNLAASGTLEVQIERGTLADIFISTAKKQVDALTKKNMIDVSTLNSRVSFILGNPYLK